MYKSVNPLRDNIEDRMDYQVSHYHSFCKHIGHNVYQITINVNTNFKNCNSI